MPTWILPTLVGLLAFALLALGVLTLAQARALDQANEEVERLERDVAALESEVDDLETRLEAADRQPDTPGDGDDDARDGGSGPFGGFEDLFEDGELEELFRDELEELGELFGEDQLGELFGDDGLADLFGDDGLGGLFGGPRDGAGGGDLGGTDRPDPRTTSTASRSGPGGG